MDVTPVGTLARAKTTINVPANARERITGATTDADGSPRGNGPPTPTVVARSNTAIATSRPAQAGLPTRALTVRKASVDDAAPANTSPKPSEQIFCVILHNFTYPIGSFLQEHLPTRQNSLKVSWIRTHSHPRHPDFHRSMTASQIGRGTIPLLHLPVRRRARSEARSALARSSDASHGALSRRACTMTRKKATARASGTRCTSSRRSG
jgi:hypothetical protein